VQLTPIQTRHSTTTVFRHSEHIL